MRFLIFFRKGETGGTAGKMDTGHPRGVSPYFKFGNGGPDSDNFEMPVFTTSAVLPQMGFNLV
jgi:hypothetical protein